MTKAQHIQYTYNNSIVHTIKADLASISVVNIKGKPVVAQPYFGVNGSFFEGSTSLGIAMQNGAAVASGGEKTARACQGDFPETAGKLTKRGTMFCYNNGNSIATGVVEYASEAKLGNVKWAIGGYSLFPNVQYATTEAYYQDINGSGTTCKDGTQNAYRFEPKTSTRARTAIGYDGSKIWLAAFEKSDAWNVRKFMMARGCNIAIMLDGGSSTQMNYAIVRGGEPVAQNYDAEGKGRGILSMVRVSATEWI